MRHEQKIKAKLCSPTQSSLLSPHASLVGTHSSVLITHLSFVVLGAPSYTN